jgi:signal transduction histidine kinase
VLDGTPYIVHGLRVSDSGAQYFEFVSAAEYERTLSVLGLVLALAATATTIAGAAAGWFVSRRVLHPLRDVADSATRISGGDLAHRMDSHGDVDLEPVAVAFNEMAGNVEARIERERRFTADVSHELRTPLTALGAAVSLAKRSKSDDRFESTMAVVEEQLHHLTRLTVELLEICRIDSGQGEVDVDDVDVGGLVCRVLQQAGVEVGRLSVASDRARRWSLDGTRIERVVANLVENAQRYGGGVTAVVVDVVEDDLMIVVDDAGPGVPHIDRTTIFGRFNRGSMPQPRNGPKGSGLGLALVEEHVRLHGGAVWVEDAPTGGARFVVTLPKGMR